MAAQQIDGNPLLSNVANIQTSTAMFMPAAASTAATAAATTAATAVPAATRMPGPGRLSARYRHGRKPRYELFKAPR